METHKGQQPIPNFSYRRMQDPHQLYHQSSRQLRTVVDRNSWEGLMGRPASELGKTWLTATQWPLRTARHMEMRCPSPVETALIHTRVFCAAPPITCGDYSKPPTRLPCRCRGCSMVTMGKTQVPKPTLPRQALLTVWTWSALLWISLWGPGWP